MFVRQLVLTNFRNYVRLGLELGPGVSIFVGENAQGKSNLLEAIHVLATTRSLRATTERELIYWRAGENGIPFARLEARIPRTGGELHVEILMRGEPGEGAVVDAQRVGEGASSFGKTIKLNGLASRAAQLVGQVNVVLFSPEDVALASGPPAGRRRYLDITNSQVNPLYLRALQRYNRLLVQRNHLLRQIRERRQSAELLAPWNEEQASLGASIVAQRLKMVAGINAIVDERFRRLSGTQQRLEIIYNPTSLPASVDDLAELDLGRAFRARLDEVASREVDLAVSLVGPHRDDFSFRLDGVDLITFGSRGQQRLAVLALKLAEAEFMQVESGERPILLLDDVLSELDPIRRALVLERAAPEGQTLITTTDLTGFPADLLGRAEVYCVSAGTVERPGVYNPGTSTQVAP